MTMSIALCVLYFLTIKIIKNIIIFFRQGVKIDFNILSIKKQAISLAKARQYSLYHK